MHEPEAHLAEALPAELGRQVRRPQPALAHALLQRMQRAVQAPASRSSVSSGQISSRTKRRHPVELGLEGGLGAEVPRHGQRGYGGSASRAPGDH